MTRPAEATNTPRDFLFEIGTEELPASAARSVAESQMASLGLKALKEARLTVTEGQIDVWVSPRRLAIHVRDLSGTQNPEETVERGPMASVAFDGEGKPTRAAQGFAKSKGVRVEDLEVVNDQGKDIVVVIRRQEGSHTLDVLPEVCIEILSSLSFSKTMRWDESSLRFSRPVRWLVAKYGDETVVFEAFGLISSALSRGHRFLGRPEVEIESADSYMEKLLDAGVIADHEERRRLIINGLDSQAKKHNTTWEDPAGKLEEIIYLVELPSVQCGTFGEEHLRLPARVLITAMQSHQRYFPMIDSEGELYNGFLYVMNAGEGGAVEITEGNERILEGRIEDAEFSYDKDLETGIEAMAAGLGEVVFHGRLGSLDDKTARLQSLVHSFTSMLDLDNHDEKTAITAAKLAKADLVSVMVQEFPDLEGYIGSVYAEMEGYPSDVCAAIAGHYMPTSAGGELPATVPAAILAVCDKVDNIVGAFSVDELPTGSRDPYGLRRAAVGIAAISREYGFDFDLEELLTTSHLLYIEQKADIDKSASLTRNMIDFIYDRVQRRQVESGMPVEVFEAARSSGTKSVLAMVSLAEALEGFRSRPEFEDLHTAYFRCSKIAAKAEGEEAEKIDTGLMEEETERQLYDAVEQLYLHVQEHMARSDYPAALAEAASIRPLVDRFFDEVMVMAEDEKLRRNRLALVRRAADVLLFLGDPMQVAAAPKP